MGCPRQVLVSYGNINLNSVPKTSNPTLAPTQMGYRVGQTYLEQVVALIHTHFYPALTARHRPPHHRHNKLQLRLLSSVRKVVAEVS